MDKIIHISTLDKDLKKKQLKYYSGLVWKGAAVGMTTHMQDNVKRNNESFKQFTDRMLGEG